MDENIYRKPNQGQEKKKYKKTSADQRIMKFLDTQCTEMGQSVGLPSASASLLNDRLHIHKTNLMILGMRKKSGLLRNKFAVN